MKPEPPAHPSPLHKRSEHHEKLRAAEAMLRRNVAIAGGVVTGSLGIGVLGYHSLGALPWVDATLNAAMILTGMGPVDRMESAPGKLFATFYAMFSGVAFLSLVALLLVPLFRRGLHKFHLDLEGD